MLGPSLLVLLPGLIILATRATTTAANCDDDRVDPYGSCLRPTKIPLKKPQGESWHRTHQPHTEDLASSLINNIHSVVNREDYDLANPHDYPYSYTPEDGEEFDVIIVGAGSAGSVMGNRLSEVAGWKILLLEAGGYPSKLTEVPGLNIFIQKTHEDWGYQTEPSEQSALGSEGRRCNWPRGRVLGGCSSINANLYVRGNPIDYNGWETEGCVGWDYKSVLPYFKKSEDMRAEEVIRMANYKDYHGVNGYLKVNSFTDYGIEDFKSMFSKGMKELGYNFNQDCNGESQMGFINVQGTITDGKRCSAAKAFLKPIKSRTNFKLATHSLATKILIDEQSKTAYGIKFINKDGKEVIVKAKKEIIASAGVINSPQLLMLSGIGPKEHLEEMGIKVIQDLPVGENLQDHMMVVGQVFSHNYTMKNKPQYDYMYDFLRTSCSKLSGIGFLKYASFINTKNNKLDYPNIQIHHTQFGKKQTEALNQTLKVYNFIEEIANQYRDINSERYITIPKLTLLQPKSRGKVLLASTDPRDKPRMISGYYTDEGAEDLETYLEAVDFVSKLAATNAMKVMDTKFHEIVPPPCKKYPISSRDFRICALKHLTVTIYHQTSTCRMGPENDPTAVVNPRFEVKGVKHLRVVDGSAMRRIVRGNINAPIIMMAEYASDMIKEKWLSN